MLCISQGDPKELIADLEVGDEFLEVVQLEQRHLALRTHRQRHLYTSADDAENMTAMTEAKHDTKVSFAWSGNGCQIL